MSAKVHLSFDKSKWLTSPLPGHIVLVSTVNRDKTPNVAPKSWISMVAPKPAIIGFGCNLKHQTARNVLETRESVINVPSEDLVENIWKTGELPHNDAAKLQELGFTLIPSVKVSPPSVQERNAHLECIYDSDKRYGDEIWTFGEITSASINKKALEGSNQERYRRLNPIFYLEEKTYGSLGDVKTIQMKI